MDWNQDFVSVTVDSHRVVIVLVFVDCRCELNVDFLRHSSWYHAFLLVPYFEVIRLWRQDVKTLW